MYYDCQQEILRKMMTSRTVRITFDLRSEIKSYSKHNEERRMPKKIVNIRLRPDQEERINAIVERSAILDTSKFVRIAVDWLLMSDIGEVISKIVNSEKFPDYRTVKKPAGRKKRSR